MVDLTNGYDLSSCISTCVNYGRLQEKCTDASKAFTSTITDLLHLYIRGGGVGKIQGSWVLHEMSALDSTLVSSETRITELETKIMSRTSKLVAQWEGLSSFEYRLQAAEDSVTLMQNSVETQGPKLHAAEHALHSLSRHVRCLNLLCRSLEHPSQSVVLMELKYVLLNPNWKTLVVLQSGMVMKQVHRLTGSG